MTSFDTSLDKLIYIIESLNLTLVTMTMSTSLSPWRDRAHYRKQLTPLTCYVMPARRGGTFFRTEAFDKHDLRPPNIKMTVLPCVINVVKIWHGKTAVSWYPSTGRLCTRYWLFLYRDNKTKGRICLSSRPIRLRSRSQFFRPIGFWKCTHTQIQKQDQITVSCTLYTSSFVSFGCHQN